MFSLFINGVFRNKRTDYTDEIFKFNSRCVYLFNQLQGVEDNIDNLQNIIDLNTEDVEIFITDKEGNIILKPRNNFERQIDVKGILNKQGETNFKEKQIRYYNIKQLEPDKYVVFSKILILGDEMKFFILGLCIFIFMFLTLTYGRVKYIENLSKGLMEISRGRFDYRVPINGKDEITVLGENINYMVQELENMKEKEHQAEKNKDMLIANVSHDLRTPLTSIVGYVKLLKEKAVDKQEINKYIDIIDDKAHRLEQLINDLFEYTKLTAFDIKLNKVDISLNEFMRQVVEGMMPICNQNDLNIMLKEPEEELFVNIDADKMVRVFENIIINAVRYSSKPGEIMVEVSKTEKGALVSVQNHGSNINDEELSKVFERFYRTDEARRSETGGSGLGLSIAKSIVELHGGAIWAESYENNVSLKVLIL